MCSRRCSRRKTRSGRRNWPGCSRSSACIRRWEAAGSRGWRSRSMLFKPNEADEATGKRLARKGSGAGGRFVATIITLLILGGLGYVAWTAMQQRQATKGGNGRPDLPVPVLAATPKIQDVPVYLDGVGMVRALNT